MFVVYVIYNKERVKIYIGQTSDLVKRLERHNKELPSKIKSYTNKNGGKWSLVYTEKFNYREDAIRREKELKSFKGREFIWKIINKGA